MAEDPRKEQFPEPLRRFVEIDRDGDASFSYAGHCGWLKADLQGSREKLEKAIAMRKGADREKALGDVLTTLARAQDDADAVSRQWRAYLDEIIPERRALRHG